MITLDIMKEGIAGGIPSYKREILYNHQIGAQIMKNIAPNITRQRLLIEASYSIEVTRETVTEYLLGLAAHLHLRTYGEPIIHSPGGEGKAENQGFDAFVPLIDSGISLYVWTNEKFMSCVLYTCKEFSVVEAIKFTQEFFEIKEIVHQEF